MELVLNTPGAYLRIRDACFFVKTGDARQIIAPKKVRRILVTTAVQVSSDALQMAMEHNIDVLFLDRFGDPFGRLWHAKLGSTTRIRRGQLIASSGNSGLDYAKAWLITKTKNQQQFLESLGNKRPARRSMLAEKAQQLKTIIESLSLIETKNGNREDIAASLRGLEGTAGRLYFEALAAIQAKAFPFKGRSRRPAKDEFNAILNYCYGVLYGLVERACLLSGLEPYLGFLHADNYNRKTLIFDLIEPYRIWAEETTVYLFSQRKVRKEMFNKFRNGITLNKEGKQIVIVAFNERLDGIIRYKSRNISRRNIIQFDCQAFAQKLLKIDLSEYPEQKSN